MMSLLRKHTLENKRGFVLWRKLIVTIARQYGSGGKTIGQMLAENLGVNCYNREILRMASDDSGIKEELFNQADEKLRK